MKYVTLCMFLCSCFIACNNDSRRTNSIPLAKTDTTSSYKNEKEIEAANEHNSIGEWREPDDGDEAIEVTKLLITTQVPCGEFLIRDIPKSHNSYLCACKLGVDDTEQWTYLTLWPSIGKWKRVASSAVVDPAPKN